MYKSLVAGGSITCLWNCKKDSEAEQKMEGEWSEMR